MNATLPAIAVLLAYAGGYFLYSKFLSEKVFRLRKEAITPAHSEKDGIDFVPTNKYVLFGHHYASIAGLAPMLGPAVAVVWGWLPALLWVTLGAIFIGCVHDFGSLVVSARAKGQSIGAVAQGIIHPRARLLFHIIIFFLVALAMGVFVYVIALLFSPAPSAENVDIHFPQAVTPSFGLMLIAAVMGYLIYKKNASLKVLTPVGLLLLFALIGFSSFSHYGDWLGLGYVGKEGMFRAVQIWSAVLLFYAFLASILPVWSLLQPRDFLNSLLLYVGLIGIFAGFFVVQPDFVAPATRMDVEGSPGLFPFVFIIIACGAASGFHSLVASGTTARQLDKETDARFIGYGGMLGESLLGFIAVLATTAGMASEMEWGERYANWGAIQSLGPQVGVFIQGCSRFLAGIGIPLDIGASFISVIVVSYALTSLDSATRLLRYNIEEIGAFLHIRLLQDRYLASLLAIASIAFFAYYEIGGKPAGLALWQLFGTTNQILAGLALLVITVYLLKRKWAWYVSGIPMVLLLVVTIDAMVIKIQEFYNGGQDPEWPLVILGSLLLVLAVWLIVEGILAIYRYKKKGVVIEDYEVETQH